MGGGAGAGARRGAAGQQAEADVGAARGAQGQPDPRLLQHARGRDAPPRRQGARRPRRQEVAARPQAPAGPSGAGRAPAAWCALVTRCPGHSLPWSLVALVTRCPGHSLPRSWSRFPIASRVRILFLRRSRGVRLSLSAALAMLAAGRSAAR